MNFKTILKTHSGAIIVAVLLGLMMVLSQIFFVLHAGSEYKGLYILKTDAEEHYLARIQDAVDGYGVGNPFLYEGKGQVPSASFTITEWLLSLPSQVLPIDTPTLNLVYKFLLPVIIFFLLYALALRLTGERLWSITIAVAVILGYTIFTVDGIKDLLMLRFHDFPANLYTRPVNPEFGSILFLTYLHILLSLFRSGSKKLFIWLAVLFGFSFYIYFYTFTFFLALNTVCLLVWIFKKQKFHALAMIGVIVSGFVVGSGALMNLLKLTHHPDYVYLAPISNILSSHKPVFSALGLLVLVFFGIHVYVKRKALRTEEYFLGSLLATAFIAINQQVVTGIMLQEGHYHWYFNTPIYILILLWLGFEYSKKLKPILKKILLVAIIVLSFVVTIAGQYAYYLDWAPQTLAEQHMASALYWLRENTEKTDVVLANNALSLAIPIYTQANVSWNYFSLAYLSPLDRTIYSLFVYLKMNGVRPSDIPNEKYFHPPVVNMPETKNNTGYEFGEVNILLRDYMTGIYPENMKEMYEKFYKLSWAEIFAKYKLDYIVWDTVADPKWNFGQDSLKKVFEQDGVIIYKLK